MLLTPLTPKTWVICQDTFFIFFVNLILIHFYNYCLTHSKIKPLQHQLFLHCFFLIHNLTNIK